MRFIAQEVREHLAELGFRSIAEAVGRSEVLDVDAAVQHWKTRGLDLRPIFHKPELPEGAARHCTTTQDHGLEKALDNTLIQLSEGALRATATRFELDLPVRNVNRTVGTMLGYEVTKRCGGRRPARRHHRRHAHRVGRPELRRVPAARDDAAARGDSNDYVGKGLSGGRITCARTRRRRSWPRTTSSPATCCSTARRAARRSSAASSASGSACAIRRAGRRRGHGDHGCEYMTGGRAVVLGGTGRNFAAGMSGGVAFVLDEARLPSDATARWSTSTARRDDRELFRALVEPPRRDRVHGAHGC